MEKKCANCEHLGRDCPKQMLYLTLDNLIDWCRSATARLHLTHDDVAKTSGVPKGTIDRVLSRQSADCKYATIHAIVVDLLGRLGVESPCLDELLAADSAETEALMAQNAEMERKLWDAERENRLLQKQVDSFASDREFLRSQVNTKDRQLGMLSRTLKGWRIAVISLGSLVFLLLSLVIVALLVDKVNPNIGFFWLG